MEEDIEMGPLLGSQNVVPSNNQISTGSKELLNAVLNNKINEIDSFFLNSTRETLLQLLQEKCKDYDGKCLLLIACDEDQVTKETLSFLYASIKSNFGTIKWIDENRFGWEPIHYVAKNANQEKLEVLLDHLESEEINSLTYFSENALHILLQYEKSVTSMKVDLFDGFDSTSCTIIAKENDNSVKCAKILMDRGIDINHANFWNETPICLAINCRFSRIWEELLRNSYIDVDSYFISGQTIREYLILNNLTHNVSLQSSAIEENVTILFNFLKAGDEKGFIRNANEAKGDWVKEEDGSGTMLQFCLRKGFLEYLQDACSKKEYKDCDIRNSPMLKTFCRKGYSRCIDYLLDNGADPTITTDKFKTPLLEYAALRGYYPYVAILLYHKDSKVGIGQIFEVLEALLKKEDKKLNISDNDSFYRKCVLYLLLNKLVATFHRVKEHLTYDKINILNKTMSKLDLESADNSIDTELVCQLLHLGSSLTETTEGIDSDSAEIKKTKNKMVIDLLDINTLRGHLDDCVENNSFIYNSIIEDFNNNYSETVIISFLASDKIKKKLLVHPLFIHFISKKWTRIAWVFYLDLLFYFLFLFSIWVYMITLHANTINVYCTSIFLLLLGVHLVKETAQLIFLYHWQYFKDSSNILELTVIISCLVTFIFPNIYSMIVAILFATAIFFIMLGQLPIFAKYTIIFGSAKYFFEYTGFYFMQFLSFSICFYIIFPFKPEEQTDHRQELYTDKTNSSTERNTTHMEQVTGDIFKSLFYTLIHFTGEFNDRVLEPTDYPVFGRVIMTIFIFCMTIILNNLLVGLIVADMDDIQKSGRLYKQVKIAKFIQTTDTFIKRIHDWKWLSFIKDIIRRIQLFKKRQIKNLHLSEEEAYKIFDDENKEYLKKLKTNKQLIFDRNVLKECYELIKKNNSNLSNTKKTT